MSDASRPVRLREEGLWWALLAVLILVSVLNNTAVGWLGPAGEGALGAIVAVGSGLVLVGVAFTGAVPRRLGLLVLCIAYLYAVYIVRYLATPDPDGIKNVAATAGTLTYLLFALLYQWRQATLRVLSGALALFLAGTVGLYVVEAAGGDFTEFAGVFANRNTHGQFILLSFFAFVATWQRETGVVRRLLQAAGALALFFVVATGARSAWLALVGAGFSFAVWPRLDKSRVRHFGYLVAVFVGVSAIVAFILLLPVFEPLQALNQLATTYTGADLTTGRELVWADVLTEIEKYPWFGQGPHVTAQGFGGLNLHSAHNLYFQILLQGGIAALVGFLAVVASLWGLLWSVRRTVFARLTAAVLVAVLIQQTFEVSLTQNNLTLGLLALSVIGIGASRALHDPGSVDAAPGSVGKPERRPGG